MRAVTSISCFSTSLANFISKAFSHDVNVLENLSIVGMQSRQCGTPLYLVMQKRQETEQGCRQGGG